MKHNNIGNHRAKRGNLRYLEESRELARANRQKMTESEKIVWNIVRNRRLGHKFTRQKPINRFILDFYCSNLLLAIEIDGAYHQQRKNYDDGRDNILKQFGIKTARFTDKQVTEDENLVKIKINQIITERQRELYP